MDVKGGILWFPTQLAKLLYEGLLEVIGEIVLSTEEDNATFRNYTVSGS